MTQINSYKKQNWQFITCDESVRDAIAEKINIPKWQADLLSQRQLSTPQVKKYLHPDLADLPSPFLFKDMNKAVEIVEDCLADKKSLVIVGDYDVDGVTGVAVLARFFRSLDARLSCLHPNRFKDGYGLKADLVMETNREPGVVITVDCGISDAKEVGVLKEAGWQVIITDHHQPPVELPKAEAILNPWLRGCKFPFKDLAGVGVAFYLAMGIRNHLVKKNYWSEGEVPNLKILLDLVAIGSIADMVDLQGVNRILTKAGLEVIDGGNNLGLQQLINLSGLSSGINSEDISFQLSPRINAAGRMGEAGRASKLLQCKNIKEANRLAKVLDDENSRRKEITGEIVESAMLKAQKQGVQEHCIIVHDPEWHEGLIGIVASNLVNYFHKPAIVLTGKENLKGSCRSIEGVNIHDLLVTCEDLLTAYGGHNAAAGLSINIEQLEDFRQRVESSLAQNWDDRNNTPVQLVNLNIASNIKIDELISFNNLMQPFGMGNPEPAYCTGASCSLRNIKLIGKERNHIRFDALINGQWLNTIGFGFGKEAFERLTERMDGCRMVFHLQYNSYKGRKKIQLRLLDFAL